MDKEMHKSTIRALACAAWMATVAAGCGGAAPTSAEPMPQPPVEATTVGSAMPEATAPQTPPTDSASPTPPMVPAPDQLPPGFPPGVPTPSLAMLSAVATGDTFTLRYLTTDARTDIEAYGKQLDEADFMKTGEVDALEGQQRSLTITAMTGAVDVEASAYGPDADDGGSYMEVIVVLL